MSFWPTALTVVYEKRPRSYSCIHSHLVCLNPFNTASFFHFICLNISASVCKFYTHTFFKIEGETKKSKQTNSLKIHTYIQLNCKKFSNRHCLKILYKYV